MWSRSAAATVPGKAPWYAALSCHDSLSLVFILVAAYAQVPETDDQVLRRGEWSDMLDESDYPAEKGCNVTM